MSNLTGAVHEYLNDDVIPLASVLLPDRPAKPVADPADCDNTASTTTTRRPRKLRRVTHTVNHQAPKASRYFYLPSGELGDVGFTSPLKAKVFATHSGYFVRFPKKILSYKVIIRAFCAVPVTRKRFQFLFRKAIDVDEQARFRDREPDPDDFHPLKFKETRHLRTLIANGRI